MPDASRHVARSAAGSTPTGSSAHPAGAVPGIAGYPGPFPVGAYALALRDRLRRLARVCVLGELSGWRVGRGPNIYFELRDGDGALPCAMWRNDFERLGLRVEDFGDGLEVVAAGGCDYYPGGPTASPRFTFRVQELRLAGEGDLLARLDRLRRQLAAEGLLEPQKRLRRPLLPRSIGVVTAEGSAARRDLLAALERRSWRGRIVWGYAAVQDRRAAAGIAAAIRELAAVADVEAIVVTRGGGSIADLWAFCDQTLCRTVALLPVPVVSAVGHEVDRPLIDDVAAVSCSTPTHAAEAAVGVDCARARASVTEAARQIEALGRAAVVRRARELGAQSRSPREHLARHRVHLRQKTRELGAASRRRVVERTDYQRRIAANVIARKLAAAAHLARKGPGELAARGTRLERSAASARERRASTLREHAAALRAGDPDRALARGFALLLADDGEPLSTSRELRAAERFDVRLVDGTVPARVRDCPP